MHYEPISITTEDSNSRKRQREESSDDEVERNDYRSFLQRRQQEHDEVQNEFDRYMNSPPPLKQQKTLDYWRDYII